jgi:hypothetical protein
MANWWDKDEQIGGKPPEEKPLTAGQVAQQAVTNLPRSVSGVIGGVVEAITSPVQTAKTVLDLGAGVLQNILPESMVQAIGEDKASRELANRVGQFYVDRYGSVEGAKKAIATDPAGVLADISTVLTGGAMVAPKAGGVASALSKAAYATDPLVMTAKAASATAQAAGKGAKAVLGSTTGVGGEAIQQAFEAGRAGGQQAKSFTENLRGKVGAMEVLDAAKQNLSDIQLAKQNEYRSGMVDIKNDKTVLDFAGIDNAINNAINKVTYKGQVKNKDAAERLSTAKTYIEEWKALDPVEYHTPEGLDALKQKVGDVLEGIPIESKTARLAVGEVYNSIKNEITKQAPTYAKVMKAYTDQSDLVREIERALSLGQKASADTAIRKLQSLMRNNVNTNYGERLRLARELERQGGRQLMPALAGQAMSDLTPRGIQRATAPITGGMGFMAGGIPLAAGTMLASSPRIVGETAYGVGQLQRGLLGAQAAAPNLPYRGLLNMLYQTQQQKELME